MDIALLRDIIVLATAGGFVTKIVVDAIRGATAVDGWWTRALALAVGVAVCLLVQIANVIPLTQATAAQAVLAGLIAGGAAIGVTAITTAVNDARASRF